MGERHRTGARGEQEALTYLLSQGCRLLERNYRTRLGEIDLVVMDGEVLVFVEVRTRTTTGFGAPLESIRANKINRIRKLAEAFLCRSGQTGRSVRFDVIGIRYLDSGAEIEHVKGAF